MDLNRATAFVRVVETGGFTRAAELLRLPPSSVSRAVSKLEEDLGVTLLERTTRKVSLTDAGRAYFERAREALVGLEEANNLALDAAREVHGVVRLAVPPEFGSKLGMVLAAFATEHPRVRIEVTFTTRGAELVGDLVDLALVIGTLPDSSLMTRRLQGTTNKLYAAPSYLATRKPPRSVPELVKHETIVFRAVAGEARWELTGPHGVEHVDVHSRMVGDHMHFVIDAAIAGLGIALLPTWIGDNLVAEAKLAPILPRFSSTIALHVLTHASRHVPRRVALLRDFLYESLAQVCTESCVPRDRR